MAELKINDSGTWRNITEVKVNDSGTWRTIQDIKVNDSGTWRTVFQYLTVTMPNVDVGFNDPFFGSGFATLSIASAGTYAASSDTTGTGEYGADSGTWMTAGTNTD